MSENINTELARALIRHLVFLERLENGEIKEINKIFKQKSAEIAQLMRANADIPTGSTQLSTLTADQQRKLFDLHRQIDAVLIAGQVAVTEKLSSALFDFAITEREMIIELLNANIPPQVGLSLQLKALPLEDIVAMVNTPLGGLLFHDRLRQDTLFASSRIQASLVDSLLSGRNITQASREVQKILGDALINRAETLVRTEYSRVQTQVNLAAMRDNEEFLKGFIFVATLDFKVCPICKRLHGRFFKVNHNFIIPVHARCRCGWMPQVKNWRDLGLSDADVPKDIRDMFDGKPPDMSLDFDDFLKTQSEDFQKEALGAARWALWKQGYSVKQMATDTRALTLDEIRAKTKQYARQ